MPAASAVTFPPKVDAASTGARPLWRYGSSDPMISARPPTAACGRPPPIDLLITVRSGVTPWWACAPPYAIGKVTTSSKISTIPSRSVTSRSRFRNSVVAGTIPAAPMIGSIRTAANSAPSRSSTASAPSGSLNGNSTTS